MTRPPTHLPSTPGQTVGPFFGYSLPYDGGEQLVARGTAGAVRLHGYVFDGAGDPVPDALIEVWQRDPDGRLVTEPGSLRRDGWTFTGWGRCPTDATGHWGFTTLTPGAAPDGVRFWALVVFARGLLDRLVTRAYLPDAPPDVLLDSLPDDRRASLVADADEHGYRFDIRLQGERETVFLTHRD